jgi:hypothetical protein
VDEKEIVEEVEAVEAKRVVEVEGFWRREK